ncbi:MAG: DUF89 family protein [Candidatus Methanomethylophilaceae archaeon]|nr:DUF89 family protein [Candidatus Methanomethylophilaceae archaeon]
MKIQADCIPCLMKRALFQCRLDDRVDDYSAMEACAKAMAKALGPDKTTSEVGTAVHEASYAKMLTEDPYKKIKVSADNIADGLAMRAQSLVDNSENKFGMALLIAAVGNILDFGIDARTVDSPEDFGERFDAFMAEGLGLYDEELINSLLLGARRITYVFDNCGESQLDRILIRELRKNGKHVIGVVRGKPIFNDVTKYDAERSGLAMDLDEIYDTGKFYVGVDWENIPEDTKNAVLSSDLIIMKGMANYESASEKTLSVPVIHILRAKCVPVAKSVGVPQGTNAVFAVLNGRRMDR